MAQIDSMVRTGYISDIDKSKGLARVCFPDMNNMVSDWLYVMRYPHMSVSVFSAIATDASASLTPWFPKVNDKVLVLMAYGFSSDGFILGVIQ